MAVLNQVRYEEADPKAQAIFDGMKEKMGQIPNIYATMANSPVALEAALNFGEALQKGELRNKEIEAIALAVAQENGCNYCLAAHTAVGKMYGLTEEDTAQIRQGNSKDPKLAALANLARDIVASRGYPSEESLNRFFEAGYSKGALVEVIAQVARNILNNYLNHIAETPVDFPEAPDLRQTV